MNAHPLRPVNELLAEIPENISPIVVVTGGDPLMHDLGPLTTAIQTRGLKAHIETSGAHPLSGDWDWITLSPKKFKAALPEALAAADELKVVIYHPSDLDWAEEHARHTKPSCRLYLQPEWSRRDQVTPLILDRIKQDPRWTLSLQVHKYIGVP